MLNRNCRVVCSLLCAALLLAGLLTGLAPTAQAAAGDVWENKADVSWIDSSKKLVAFTFDDGPVGTAPTASSQRIMDVLERYHMHCTYFYWGEKINDSNIDEIRRAYSLGCELGNHSFTHPYLDRMQASQIREEIGKTNALLAPISGNEATLIRPPYGNVNNTVSNSVNAPLINWSLDSGDWNNGNYTKVVNQIRNNIKDGDIILCHQTYDFTAEAIETLIPELVEQGFVIVSVSELMKMKGVEMTVGTVYTNQARNKPNVVITPPAYELAAQKIDAIGEVTLEREAAITEARTAYDALTAEEKDMVSNYFTLILAETTLERLKTEYKNNKAAAQTVDEKIAALGEVTFGSEPAIVEARSAYDALTDAQKALVANLAQLTAAEEGLQARKDKLVFTDVATTAYYADAVVWAVERDVTTGTSADTFSPGRICTRGQVVAFLWRANGSPEPKTADNPFADVKDNAYYYKAVLWAVENGITAGISKTAFGPGRPCTRAQVVTFLWRSEHEPAPESTECPFTDANPEGFYYKAMLWAVEKEITKGTGADTFSPEKNCSRGQIVSFLYRSGGQ